MSGDLSSISLRPPQIFLVVWTVNALSYAYSCGHKNINMFSAFLGGVGVCLFEGLISLYSFFPLNFLS